MFMHLRIENCSLLVNGITVSKFPLTKEASSLVEKLAPEDWPMLRALIELAPQYDNFEYDLLIDSGLEQQIAMNSLLLCSTHA